jgi:hypothetical protein
MKGVFILSAFAMAGIQAQDPKGPPKGPPKDAAGAAAAGAKGGNSGIMSALGQLYGEKGVPYGPAPKGCSAFEVMYGRLS